MDFFARLIDSLLLFVYFAFTSKETRQNPATATINVKIIHSFWVLRACIEIHTPTLGMKLTSVVCKLEIKINLSKSKEKLRQYSKSISTNQMCNHALIQNQYAPPDVESRPYSKSICTSCEDLNQGPSACKQSVQTTTPPVLDTILIEQQAIILPR